MGAADDRGQPGAARSGRRRPERAAGRRGRVRDARRQDRAPVPDEGFAAYQEAVGRAEGREVGLFRNTETGAYVVRVGDAHHVKSPGKGWETVVHHHTNPKNVLTRRMPAPKDVHDTKEAAKQAGQPITELLDYALPDGRRGMAAYTVSPKGEVTLRFEHPDGSTVTRRFKDVDAYADHYGERTTYVDPKSPEYEWMSRTWTTGAPSARAPAC